MNKISEELLQSILDLNVLTCKFARIERQSFHEDGKTVETDSDHTVSLSIMACSIAHALKLNLDIGKIAQYSIVHDLVEAYSGDTPAVKALTSDQKNHKDLIEEQALRKIAKEFGDTLPWIHKTIEAYESRNDPEARFVKVIDKAQPKALAILNGAITIFQARMEDSAKERFDQQIKEATEIYASDQLEAIEILTRLINKMLQTVEINKGNLKSR